MKINFFLYLSGLLKNHKNVSEYSSGLDGHKNKNLNDTRKKRPASNNENSFSSNSTEPKTKKIKIIKKNMDIFE
jgi:hypothetical protein